MNTHKPIPCCNHLDVEWRDEIPRTKHRLTTSSESWSANMEPVLEIIEVPNGQEAFTLLRAGREPICGTKQQIEEYLDWEENRGRDQRTEVGDV